MSSNVDRRGLLARLAAAGAAGVVAFKAEAAETGVPKVAYHLSDADKVSTAE